MTVLGISLIVGGLALVAAAAVLAYRDQPLQERKRQEHTDPEGRPEAHDIA